MMTTIKTIVATTDFSLPARYALDRAAVLARELHADLDLLHVISGGALRSIAHFLSGAGVEATRRIVAQSQSDLAAVASELGSGGALQVKATIRAGDVVGEILTHAGEDDYTLLVCGAHGADAVREFLVGTTTERVLRKTQHPLLAVKKQASAAYRRVLVAVDFSAHSRPAMRLARVIAPQAEITVLHAFEVAFEPKLHFAGVADEDIQHYRRQARQEARRNMDELLEQCGYSPDSVRVRIEHGHAQKIVLAVERELQADLLVMGKHGQSLLEELLLGSVTRHALAYSNCDLLASPDFQPDP